MDVHGTHTDPFIQTWTNELFTLEWCWFSEMPQVRCHVHRSAASKLRPLCFFMPGSSPHLVLAIIHTNTLSWDFISTSFHVQNCTWCSMLLLLQRLTRLAPNFSLSVITVNAELLKVLYESLPPFTV